MRTARELLCPTLGDTGEDADAFADDDLDQLLAEPDPWDDEPTKPGAG